LKLDVNDFFYKAIETSWQKWSFFMIFIWFGNW